MIYFTSDLHFYHDNIIKHTGRPFPNSEIMNKRLIANWNNKVNANDEVYILGDLTMKSPEYAEEILSQLKGTKHLIRGNHDRFVRSPSFNRHLFKSVSDYKTITYNSTYFILCHYPFLEWDGFYRGSFHLHGHQHNKADYNCENKKNGIRRYDVGVDANNFFPASIEEIIRFFL